MHRGWDDVVGKTPNTMCGRALTLRGDIRSLRTNWCGLQIDTIISSAHQTNAKVGWHLLQNFFVNTLALFQLVNCDWKN